MGWLRTRRWVSVLALLALALQLAVSFAHVHPDDLLGRPHAAATAPDESADHHDADGVCDICVAVALLATAPLAVPPVIARVVAPAQRIAFAFTRIDAVATTRVAFRSRAPPL